MRFVILSEHSESKDPLIFKGCVMRFARITRHWEKTAQPVWASTEKRLEAII
jgi:hypothetical protein